MKLSKCCKSSVGYNSSLFKPKFICYRCKKENPETYELPKWELVSENTYKLKVESGFLYKTYWSKAYPGGEDFIPIIIFVPNKI